MSMVNIPVIARRELSAFFLSPLAYVVLTGFGVTQGILFALVLQPSVYPAWTVQWAFMLPLYLLVVAAPLLTMRLLSEETSSGTIEALMTAPVTEWEVVLGKFAGVLVFAVLLFVPLLALLVFLALHGPVDAGSALAGFMGLFLLSAQYLAIGLLFSALTRVQVGAAIMTFVALIALQFLWFLVRESAGPVAAVLGYLAPPLHYVGFPGGVVDTRDLAYFVITTAVFLFLSVKALELRRWR